MSTSMRDLIRNTDGAITRDEFKRGAIFVGLLMLAAIVLWLLVGFLNTQMEWMTVLIAPLLGAVVFVVGSSLIYFWYCLFTKRFRGLERSQTPILVMLISLLLAGICQLMAYQDRTLNLQLDGIFASMGLFALVFGFFTVFLFAWLLGTALRKQTA